MATAITTEGAVMMTAPSAGGECHGSMRYNSRQPLSSARRRRRSHSSAGWPGSLAGIVFRALTATHTKRICCGIRTHFPGSGVRPVRVKKDVSEERFVEQKVTFTLKIDGSFVIVEMVAIQCRIWF